MTWAHNAEACDLEYIVGDQTYLKPCCSKEILDSTFILRYACITVSRETEEQAYELNFTVPR